MNTIPAQSETRENLFREVQIAQDHYSEKLERLVQTENKYLKDLRINVSNALNSPALTRREAYLLAFAGALNEKNQALTEGFEALAKKENATDAELAEVTACVSLMNANNVFYRFRHFVNKDYYNQAPAGIKMTIMMNPVLGKELFELISLAVSAVNGCEMCVNSHEESVLKHGGSQVRILEAVRLAAIVKSLAVVL